MITKVAALLLIAVTLVGCGTLPERWNLAKEGWLFGDEQNGIDVPKVLATIVEIAATVALRRDASQPEPQQEFVYLARVNGEPMPLICNGSRQRCESVRVGDTLKVNDGTLRQCASQHGYIAGIAYTTCLYVNTFSRKDFQ